MNTEQHRHGRRFGGRAICSDTANLIGIGQHHHRGQEEGPAGFGPGDGLRRRGEHGGPAGQPHHDRGEHGRPSGEHGRPDGHRGGPGWGGPGRPGGRGWGGPGRHGGPRVGRGDVRGAALILLSEQPLHGYQIIQRIAERSGGLWRPSPGSVYPALQLLEDEGLLRAQEAEGRRVFTLTDAGRVYVDAHKDELTAAWTALTNTVDDRVRDLRDLLDQVGTAVRQVAQVGTESQVATARGLLVTTRRQLYRILADDDDSAPSGETVRL